MLSKTATATTMATFAEADLVGSAALVAVTVTAPGEGTLVGGVYSPPVEIVPHAAPVQPTPVMVQVTAIFEDPVTLAANCWVFDTVTVELFGLSVIVTGGALTVRTAMLLVTLPVELLTTTLNWLPESDVAVAGVV
jgi:hypothetical protein